MANIQNRARTKMQSTASLNWFKNVAKSLGYTSSEMIGEMMPASIDFATSNAQAIKDLYNDIRQLRSSGGKRIADGLNANDQISIAKKALKNALDDIKTGKIYNKERQNSIYSEGIDEDFDFEDDFSFDDSEVEETTDNEGNKKIVIHNRIETNINKNNPMVKAVNSQTQAMIKSTQSANAVNVSLAANQMAMDKKIGTGIMQGLSAINDNLGLLVRFQSESMTKYISSSLKYYEENLKVLNDTLVEMKRTTNGLSSGDRKAVKDPLEDVFLAKGGLNIKGYMNLVKKNMGNAVDSNLIASQIKFMLQDKDTLKYIAASPLSFISTKLISTMMPEMLKRTMSEMDKSFQNFFPALLMKINRLNYKSDNPILQLLGQLFGANVRTKTTADLSQYHKDATPFDGYTRKAIVEVIPGYLRKILAAVSGKQEIAFDYDEGKFKSVHEMSRAFKETQDRTILNNFSDVIDSLKNRIDAVAMDSRTKQTFSDEISRFFVNLGKTPYQVNPRRTKDKHGNAVDELKEVFQFSQPGFQKAFRAMVLSLPKNMQMQMFGSGVINSRQSLERMMNEVEQNQTRYNYSSIFNDLGFDEHIQRNKNDSTKYTARKGYGMGGVDKFNLTSLDYLRDIKKLLVEGIIVYPMNGIPSGNGMSDTGIKTPDFAKRMSKMKDQEAKYLKSNSSVRTLKTFDAQQRFSLRQQGRIGIDSPDELEGISTDELISLYSNFADTESGAMKDSQKNGFFKWMGKFFTGNTQEKYNMMREKMNQMLQAPAKLLSGVFKKIDNTMYDIIFGKDEDETNTSFFSKSMALLKGKMEKFGSWMKEEIFTPMKEALFGKDGLISQLKDSQFYKSMKSNLGKLGDYLFGKPVGENGKRENGLFSSTANEMLDIWDGAKYYFTGKAYTNRSGVSFAKNEDSVFGQMKSMFTGFKDNMKTYLFGDKSENADPNNKGVLTSALDGIYKGFGNFSEALFGPKEIGGKKNKNYIAVDEMVKKIKERAPKSLATGMIGGGAGLLFGGNLGILGSLLLPGGPIGGAVVGTTLGFLSQSDRFKDWLFGEMDDKTGKRKGNVISANMQEFFRKNKAGIVGGATVGGLKSILGFGILPSFLLPGGPIGGALAGMGLSMLTRSNAFQDFMFGKMDEKTNKRTGGILQKIFGNTMRNGKYKNLFGNMGAGAIGGGALALVTSKMGILGSFLAPGGPIGGAVLGAAAGIALSSDKWKKYLFGEFDPETQKRKGGLVGKFENWFKLSVQEPLKLKFEEINLNIQEWFTKSIANPFSKALEPLKHEFKLMTDNMKNMFTEGWDSFKTFIGDVFEKHVGMPFGKFMEDKVMQPLRNFMGKIIGGIGKIVGGVLAAPFAGLNNIAKGLTKKHEQQGLDAYISEGWSSLWDIKGRRERGEKLGIAGVFNSLKDMYFNKDKRDAARHGSKGASYYQEQKAKWEATEAEQNAKFNEKRRDINKRRWFLSALRGRAANENFGGDYDAYLAAQQTSSNPVSQTVNNIAEATGLGESYDAAGNVVSTSGETSSSSTVDGGTGSTGNSSSSSTVGGGTGSSRRGVTQLNSSKVSRTFKTQPQLINQIAIDVRTIAQEVKGQLDGVGGNVFKIRKLIQSQQGVSDEDLSGSGNRDRLSFIGKIKRALKNPLDGIKDFFISKFQGITEKVRHFGEAMVEIPKKIFTAVYDFGKELGTIAKDTFMSIVSLPGQLIKIVGGAVDGLVEGIKTIGPAIGESLLGVAKLFSGAMGMAGNALLGFGEGLGEIAFSLAEGVGDIVYGIGYTIGTGLTNIAEMLGTAGPMIVDFTFNTIKSATDFTFGAIKMVGEKLLDVGNTLLEIVASPFKFLAKGINKLAGKTNEVIIKGGTLDTVKEVQVIRLMGGNDKISSRVGYTQAMPVRIVGSSIQLPVAITGAGGGGYASSRGQRRRGGSNLFLDALNMFDDQNDKEEATRSKLAKDKQQVTRKNSNFLLSALQEKEEKNFTMSNELKQTSLLEKISRTSSEQKDNWLSIFGKKGLLTAGILLALPFLKDIMGWLKNFIFGDNNGNGVSNLIELGEKQGETRQDVDYNGDAVHIKNNSYRESLTKGIYRLYSRHVGPKIKKAYDFGRSVGNFFKKRGAKSAAIVGTDVIEDTATSAFKQGAREATETTAKKQSFTIVEKAIKESAEEGAETLLRKNYPKTLIKTAAKDITKEATEEVVKKGTSATAKKIINAITDAFGKFFKSKAVRKELGEEVAEKATKEMTEKITKTFTEKVIAKFLPQLSEGLLKTTAKEGAAAVTFGITDAIFVAWDGITGAIEAANIFMVNKDEVDWKMRVAAAVTKAFVGYFPVIDIIVEIFTEVSGIELKKYFASVLYALLGTKEEQKELKEAQINFVTEAELYNKAHGTKLTTGAYNDKVNSTVWGALTGSLKGAANGKPIVAPGSYYSMSKEQAVANYYGKPYTPPTPTKSSVSAGSYASRSYNAQEFLKSIGKGGEGGFGADMLGSNGYSNALNGFAYYSQNDPRWANVNYDYSPQYRSHSPNPYLKDRGCGPTAAAMVATQLTGKVYEPPHMAALARQNGFSAPNGTSWSFFDRVGRDFSMDVDTFSPKTNRSTLVNRLQSGEPVIMVGKRTKYGIDDSPYTSAGHFVVATKTDGNSVMINDPRGAKYSKEYNLSKVLSETSNGWAFRYNGGPTPDAAPFNSSGSTASTPQNLSIVDLFGKMAESFGLFVNDIFNGTRSRLDWGDSSSSSSTSSGFSTDFVPRTVQEAILKKTLELTVGKESGGNYSAARNDLNASTGKRISPSVGIMQWRGGNARTLMQNMYNLLPGNSEAKYFATQVNWSDSRPWSDSEQQRLRNYLSQNYSVAKQVQDSFALSTVRDTNLSKVYKYGVETGKIKDPRSIAFLGDFANSGPGLIPSYLKTYTPSSSGSEFENLYNHFSRNSYWGKRQNIYGNRMKSTYSILQSWDPEQSLGGFGELATKVNRTLSNTGRVRSSGVNFPSLYDRSVSSEVRDYISGKNSSIGAGLSDELLREAIIVLNQIASNTGDTSDNIRELINNNSTDSSNESNTNVIVAPPSSQSAQINPIMAVANDRRKEKQQREYNVAKTIAKGKIN